MQTVDLPFYNSCLNFLATCCLIAGFYFIKVPKDQKKHQIMMLGALFFSAIFLVGYLTYHYYHGSKIFPDLGWIKTLYLVILVPHIILAAVMTPMILATFFFAFTKNWTKHKKWARVTFPIWLYVSITGVLIYLMAHVWFKV